MKYLLDTDICIYLINERPKGVLARFRQRQIGDIGVSTVTVSELAYGVARTESARNRAALDAFLLPLEIVSYDLSAALCYGEVRADLAKRGRPIGPLDTQIAAHALSLSVTLVTNNVREFSRVKGLSVESWA
ncbi:MAG TPA: type II toxin-antitoxin system VapC family toxin [Burkholderiales bacterium]|jgi:tRNA(fMet)-specific endonuclease VapC|nr:type II toxin-antitoxin system VapC family toxin [Burkholderiales bacterium]